MGTTPAHHEGPICAAGVATATIVSFPCKCSLSREGPSEDEDYGLWSLNLSPRDELLEPLLERCAFEEDAAAAGQAAQADVGAKTDDLPVIAAARVHLA